MLLKHVTMITIWLPSRFSSWKACHCDGIVTKRLPIGL